MVLITGKNMLSCLTHYTFHSDDGMVFHNDNEMVFHNDDGMVLKYEMVAML